MACNVKDSCAMIAPLPTRVCRRRYVDQARLPTFRLITYRQKDSGDGGHEGHDRYQDSATEMHQNS